MSNEPSGKQIATETFVVEKDGQWMVDIVVVFADEAVRRTVNTYRTKKEADVAAKWIRRGADRNIEGPING